MKVILPLLAAASLLLPAVSQAAPCKEGKPCQENHSPQPEQHHDQNLHQGKGDKAEQHKPEHRPGKSEHAMAGKGEHRGPPHAVPGHNYRIKVKSARIRKGPGTGYGIVRTLPLGHNVVPVEVSGDWVKIDVGGQVGWVSISLLAEL
ncbi:SH3 domain-containing protein [Gallaecimonas pentaromativorans]|uniref:SH3 domain-containing protein n=1 Tax=Gallaecimonas pentaromativorans TaxID=584787 RepID=UPI003A90E2E1